LSRPKQAQRKPNLDELPRAQPPKGTTWTQEQQDREDGALLVRALKEYVPKGEWPCTRYQARPKNEGEAKTFARVMCSHRDCAPI
jgi:hypothetical protein